MNPDGRHLKLSTRLVILFSVLAFLSAVLGYASTIPLSQSDAQSISNQVGSIQPTTLSIFENNVQIALIEFIPVAGPIYGSYTSYSTGQALSAIAQTSSQAQFSGFDSFVFLLLTPIYWLEFLSYSLAVEESVSVIVALRNRDIMTLEWKWLVGTIIAVVVILLVSARLEVEFIHLFGQ